MITKMSKYSLILLSSELDDFLNKVQELGMMDITRSTVETDETSKEMMDTSSRYKNVLSRLKTFKKDYPDAKPLRDDTSSTELLEKIEAAYSRIEEINSTIFQLEKDYDESAPWGEFDNEDILKIKDMGMDIHFYSVMEKKFKQSWKENYPIQVLNTAKGKVYFAIVSPKGEEFDFNMTESKFPEMSGSKITAEIKDLNKEKNLLINLLGGYSERTKELQNNQNALFNELDFYFAKTASVKEGEGSISVLEGFAKTSDDAKIKEFLDKSNAFYIVSKAKVEDDPPVVLKNNSFAKAFEPIGNLYMLPTYGEVDLTPFFAPFYMLFFGLCLGDMGYGLMLLLIGIIACIALPKYRAYGKLVAWLGVGSILMPLLSGTFFGMKLAELFPSMPESVKGLFFTDLNMFWFSIIFGLVQIVFARLLKATIAFSNKKWDEGLTEVGWSMFIIWAALAYAGSQMGKVLISKTAGYILAIGGLVLVLFCSKPSKHFLLRPLKGIVSLYDVTGIFGDMLSYIRLFGLGLTGGILALVVNSISMSLSTIPYVGWVLTIILLIVGHLAVMGLSCLGAFVHPVRLTFVEFYKNAGFIGGGRAFNPLRTRK